MDELLASHLIDPAAARADDFVSFFRAREQAMGKPVVRDVASGRRRGARKRRRSRPIQWDPSNEAEDV
jgi:hypothetical protein